MLLFFIKKGREKFTAQMILGLYTIRNFYFLVTDRFRRAHQNAANEMTTNKKTAQKVKPI
jgi:hypothetical protein